ncbi:M48 family metallopeptidase [Ideonella sp. DXS22W]|uniref:M48 family metallopeptidase n=1 Tax=Pseudaquabacterium inlustre TaxID=2984192 RepID=A0ABU9CN24_9BURK
MTDTHFRTDAQVDLPALARHADGCRCMLHARRRLGGALLGAGVLAVTTGLPAAAAEPECKRSGFAKLTGADQIEQGAGQQYRQMLQQANGQQALAPKDHPQVKRLRYIANRIIPLTYDCNPRAKEWRWEVNLIGSKELNAFCMPGGKIAFYLGILDRLKLDDDEVAVIMGHEVAHALLEHARERMGKTMATRGAIELGAALFGLGNVGRGVADMGGQLLTLRFSRDDESEADALGLILSAQAGYRPEAGASLWRKMLAASKGAPPQWLSTHPSGETRIHEIEARYPRVMPMYEAAAKPDQRFGPPNA